MTIPTSRIDARGCGGVGAASCRDFLLIRSFCNQAKALKSESTVITNQPIILFDGVCNLCEKSVQFVIRHDASARFRFASLQSNAARKILSDANHTKAELSSVLFVLDGQVFQKSRATLQIAKRLDAAWPMLYYVFFWIPPCVADRVYDFIGNRRYQWLGKKDECWVPDEDQRNRFLTD
jgi:predicted DCC family thiol-disulfide oxidoreductase YuxK